MDPSVYIQARRDRAALKVIIPGLFPSAAQTGFDHMKICCTLEIPLLSSIQALELSIKIEVLRTSFLSYHKGLLAGSVSFDSEALSQLQVYLGCCRLSADFKLIFLTILYRFATYYFRGISSSGEQALQNVFHRRAMFEVQDVHI
ncbi:hypothetical protein SELMODRAFT_432187 [Selaginella moellendorffii]|uniref:Uncharacterized protein n=1 Tax=Selaginella moellendorffii TaxID=88036 RepID=D8TF89_SELML|nr:hypothetical protein SELMODRAFT_432187 [Selaginella moellendorffii]